MKKRYLSFALSLDVKKNSYHKMLPTFQDYQMSPKIFVKIKVK